LKRAPLALLHGPCERRADGSGHRTEVTVGDKSPKSKERDQKQKQSAKAGSAAALKAKQETHSHVPQNPLKGRR
jgi:hypothetical protein